MKTRSILSICCAALALAPLYAMAEKPRNVVGQTGKVLQASKVYTKASTRSRAYFKVDPNVALVVQPNAPKGWLKVFLNTGGYGYIQADKVALMDQQWTAEVQAATRRSTPISASRGAAPRGTAEARAWAAEKGTEFAGTPYVWGGNDIQNGIDCSGFVQKLYGAIGENLPRTAAEQAMVGRPITRYEDLLKGDRLYFWDAKRGKIGHTGIYLGDWKFVHSSSGRKGVATDDIREKKWLNILMSARR